MAERLRAGAGLDDFKTIRLQGCGEHVAEKRGVVDQQQAALAILGRSCGICSRSTK